MLQIINVGSGSKGNCTFVKSGHHILMIDAGIGIRRVRSAMEQYNLDHIDFMLVTHSHSDHISQIKKFEDIEKYGLDTTIKDVEKLPLDKSFNYCGFCIDTFRLSHDAPMTCGFYIHDGQESLTYITDTGYVPKNVFIHGYNSTYIVMECNHDIQMLLDTRRPYILKSRILGDSGHLNNQDGAQAIFSLCGPDTKEVFLAHLSQEANNEVLAYDAVNRLLSKSYPNVKINILKQDCCTVGGFYE